MRTPVDGLALVVALGAALPPSVLAQSGGGRWRIPVQSRTLDSGLTVVVSEDRSSPTVGVSVVYDVGIRVDPENRTGFAHLFEHLMFQGTPAVPKGVFDRVIEGGGGFTNGSQWRESFSTRRRGSCVYGLATGVPEPLEWRKGE